MEAPAADAPVVLSHPLEAQVVDTAHLAQAVESHLTEAQVAPNHRVLRKTVKPRRRLLMEAQVVDTAHLAQVADTVQAEDTAQAEEAPLPLKAKEAEARAREVAVKARAKVLPTEVQVADTVLAVESHPMEAPAADAPVVLSHLMVVPAAPSHPLEAQVVDTAHLAQAVESHLMEAPAADMAHLAQVEDAQAVDTDHLAQAVDMVLPVQAQAEATVLLTEATADMALNLALVLNPALALNLVLNLSLNIARRNTSRLQDLLLRKSHLMEVLHPRRNISRLLL
jgi:hypothetical protein